MSPGNKPPMEPWQIITPDLPPFDPQTPVRTTLHLEQISNRRRKLNQYVRGQKIGNGKHGDVYTCVDENNQTYELAVKAIKRTNPRDKMKLLRKNYQAEGASAMNSTINSIRREIAIMKRCRHANLVRLVEIIDDPRDDKIYMFMEYLPGGPVEWTNNSNEPILLLQQTRRIMRDVVLGLEYLHHEGIIHRDIKPANILYTKDRASVKLIDFGVAHYDPSCKDKRTELSLEPIDSSLFPKGDLLKRAGTPAFLAPEVVWHPDAGPIVASPSPSYESFKDATVSVDSNLTGHTVPVPRRRPPITKAIDIWSLGVTFYCLLFGRTPFNVPFTGNDNVHHSEFVLYNRICTQDWEVDDFIGADRLPTEGRHPTERTSDIAKITLLLDRMLQKTPKHRISLEEIKCDSWLLQDIDNVKQWMKLTSCGDVSEPPTVANWVKNKFLRLLPHKR